MRRMTRVTTAALALAAIAVVSLGSAPAIARPTALPVSAQAAEVASVLDRYPGGTETAPGVISWDDGATILTLASAEAADAVGTCASGRYCAWANTAYTGTKITFSACSAGGTTSSLALLSGYARSTANARSSGTVKAVKSGTVIYSMAPGTGRAANATQLTSLVCYS